MSPDIVDPVVAAQLKALGLGSLGTVLTLLAVAFGLYVRYKPQLIDLWNFRAVAEAEKTKITAEAEAAAVRLAAEAAETPIAHYRSLLTDVRNELKAVKAEVESIRAGHRECEQRANVQSNEIDRLKAQNAGQQQTIDSLTDKLTRLFRQTGIPEGSGPLTPLPSDERPAG